MPTKLFCLSIHLIQTFKVIKRRRRKKLCLVQERLYMWSGRTRYPTTNTGASWTQFRQKKEQISCTMRLWWEKGGGSKQGWGCKAITLDTFGGHYRASHAEWLLQVETLLTVFKMDLMKAFIQSSTLVWALDNTHSEITHSGLAWSCQCWKVYFSFIFT